MKTPALHKISFKDKINFRTNSNTENNGMEWTIFIFTDLKDGLQEVEEEIFLIDAWKRVDFA